ncbi:TOM1-like protein 7 [Phytophthora ramorum]|uniref:TOM1-like protein 7 n=1 Tax=Phytophthora ramorum TaxID=164328 RepID=UPI0030A7CACD|nr:TOM1-like protein 7 [Phytophthora ramorum]
MDAKMMQAWRKKMPSKRQLTSTLNQLVQQKSVAVLYTPTEVERITQMTDMMAQATSDYEADEDWDRILRVTDALSSVSNRAVLKESIRYLKLRLGDPSTRVVILALTLTESIVKNCGDLVHQEVATEPFMGEMEALYRTHANKRGRESMEIASRVLDMVQAWGEAFLPFRHEFPLFVDTYHNMRKKGIKFPDQYDESKVPVLTPPPDVPSGGRSGVSNRSASSNQPHASGSIDTSSYSSSSSGLGGLSTPELYRVATNVSEMFEDMLFEAQKDVSAIGNHGVMEELAVQVREIVHRMEGAIPIAVAEGDEDIAKYLSINDDLHAALKKYDALLAGNQCAEDDTTGKPKKDVPEDIDLVDPFGLKDDLSPQDNQASSDDDPFADFVRARTGSRSSEQKKPASADKPKAPEVDVKVAPKTAQEEDEDDDPFASFVQQRATKILSSSSNQDAEKENKTAVSSAPVAPAKDLIDLWDDDVLTTPALAPAPTRQAPAADLWLGDNFLSSPSQPPATQPAVSTMQPAQDPWSGNNSFSKSTTSAVSLSGPLSGTSSTLGGSSNDPFDMLDFSSKASISTANPFDSLQPASPAQPQQAPSKSFNPFDF